MSWVQTLVEVPNRGGGLMKPAIVRLIWNHQGQTRPISLRQRSALLLLRLILVKVLVRHRYKCPSRYLSPEAVSAILSTKPKHQATCNSHHLMPTISISFHHWPKCRHFLHLQPLHHLKFLILFLHQTGFVKYYLLLKIKYWPGWEVNYLRSGKGFKALSKFWRNFIDQSESLEREPDLVEREEQNKKSKLAEMWSGLHFFNLKSQSSQEHRKSLTKQKCSRFLFWILISITWQTLKRQCF